MHLCEPFLSGGPNVHFGAPLGVPCTPVKERWFIWSYIKRTDTNEKSRRSHYFK